MNNWQREQKAMDLTAEIRERMKAAKESGDRELYRQLWNEAAQMIVDAGLQMKPTGFASRAGQRQAAERRAMATRRTR